MPTKRLLTASIAAGIACSLVSILGCQKKELPSEPPSASATAATVPTPKQALTIWWAQWAPADGLQDLANEFGRTENVEVKVHQIPWANFQDQVFQEFGKNQTAFDIVVGDS